jgi:nucleoside phosphorylase/energy-coupling factor transporter ATP-binding protein EcfA2
MLPTKQRLLRKAVIVTSTLRSHEIAMSQIQDIRELVDPRGTIYQIGTFDDWEVALAIAGPDATSGGLVAASAAASIAPEVLIFINFAFSNSDSVDIGDVVVATSVAYATTPSRVSTARPLTPIRATHRVLQRAQVEALKNRWTKRRRTADSDSPVPTIFFGTIATVSPDLRKDAVPNVLAVDDRAHMVLSALHEVPQVEALVITGIFKELRKPDKKAEPEAMQKVALEAMENACAFAFEVLARLPLHPTRTPARTGTPYPPPEIAYLTSLEIKHIRALVECRWQIEPTEGPGWHVMLGDNGAGKSTLLRSIALALFDTRETEGLRLPWPSWLHTEAAEGTIAVTLARGSHTSERSLVIRRGASDTGSGIGPGDSPNRNEPASVFSAGYGPFRRFSGGDIDYEKELDVYPRLLRHMSLFSERVALTESLSWLKDLRFKQLENDPDGELLTDVRAFINNSDLLPNEVRLAEVSSDAVTFIDANGATVPIEELSDGFRSVLSLTLDLIRHMAVAYGAGNLFSPVDPFRVVVAGIVLIDEVDVHLHPSWQHRIGDWFTAHFPAVQFIVATHSPILCQGASSVFLLPQPGTSGQGRHLEGIELERVRNGNVLDAYGTGVFGHGVTRSEESKAMLRRLAELNAKEMDEALTSDEQAEQEALRAVLPTRASVVTEVVS